MARLVTDSLRSKKHHSSQAKSDHGKLLSNNHFCSFLLECVEPTKSRLTSYADLTFLGLCHARVSPPLTGEGYQVLKRLCGRLTQSNSCIVVSLLVFFSSVIISNSNGNRSN